MFADNVTHNLWCQIRADDKSSTCTLYIYDGKVSRIDVASVTIILCLHVLIFSEYRC